MPWFLDNKTRISQDQSFAFSQLLSSLRKTRQVLLPLFLLLKIIRKNFWICSHFPLNFPVNYIFRSYSGCSPFKPPSGLFFFSSAKHSKLIKVKVGELGKRNAPVGSGYKVCIKRRQGGEVLGGAGLLTLWGDC